MPASLLGGLPTPLFFRWQRQMERLRLRPVPGIGLTTVALERPINGLVPLERLLLVTLRADQWEGQPALRLSGFRGRVVPFGVGFGGPEGPVFEADLRLLPGSHPAAGLAPSASQLVLRAALRLHERLLQAGPHHVGGFRLPRLWAGFPPDVPVDGDGPELLGRSHEAGLTPRELLQQTGRRHQRLVFYPLDWVSHHWEQIEAVCAEWPGGTR